ncbi:MAG TPA: DUF4112 domain-containing protein [Opitutaceae bacterium]|nr:DUF4112 domain-containing protein [Opitutaceae bacterium]
MATPGKTLPILGDLPAHEPPDGTPTDQAARLRRLRHLAWVLDRSIPIGGGRRIGIDPLIGLVPGAGDWLGAVLSLYVLYEAARMGLPVAVLTRIAGNIAIEALIGAIPVAGDMFDFVWQANMRNLQLVERHYQPTLRPRSFRSIWLALGIFTVVLLTFIGLAVYGAVKLIIALFS